MTQQKLMLFFFIPITFMWSRHFSSNHMGKKLQMSWCLSLSPVHTCCWPGSHTAGECSGWSGRGPQLLHTPGSPEGSWSPVIGLFKFDVQLCLHNVLNMWSLLIPPTQSWSRSYPLPGAKKLFVSHLFWVISNRKHTPQQEAVLRN